MRPLKFNVPNFVYSFIRRPSSVVPLPSSLVPHSSSLVLRPSSLFPRSTSRGFTYIGLLAIIVIIGISLGAAGKYWSNVMLRDREEELLYRGDQYRQAIERYYTGLPGRPPMYPQSIDDLLKDPRTPLGKRYLRQKYKDPITGEDFEEIKDPVTRRILGVRSTSDRESLKQAEFPPTVLVPNSAGTYSIPIMLPTHTSESSSINSDKESDKENAGSGKIKYSDWLFVSTIRPGIPGGFPGGTPGGFPGGTPGGFPGGTPGGFPNGRPNIPGHP